ncbi:MAG: hypothetical protein ACI9CD_000835 [Candidatus Deianiraeaceae bacterium]|jgi:hypothetical protein
MEWRKHPQLESTIFTSIIINSSERENGVFELDESYFGAKRVRGKRGNERP